jgi:hypothetical protein
LSDAPDVDAAFAVDATRRFVFLGAAFARTDLAGFFAGFFALRFVVFLAFIARCLHPLHRDHTRARVRSS